MSRKRGLGIDVLTAARQRIAWTFDTFPRIYVSFSGGKDSSIMLHLVAAEARRRGRKIGILFVDLEAQYQLTIAHVAAMFDAYRDVAEPYWLALPISLRNAVSQIEPRWLSWDPAAREQWVREPDPRSITSAAQFPWFRPGMEFEELVPQFGQNYAAGQLCACFVGIRSDESLNRWRTIAGHGTKFEGRPWTNYCGRTLYNIYPIYDWRTEDLWTYVARERCAYNQLYDRMHQAGLTLHQMRICQPYGDDQRKGLWLYHLIEPQTWGRVVARVAGANSGALYSQETGNVQGRIKITKPPGHTWESFAKLLISTMPPRSKEHYENKIHQFLSWYRNRGYPNGIPDEAPHEEEASRKTPSWRRVAKSLLRNDYWMKGLSFTQTKSEAYEKYLKIMKKRRSQWNSL
jgi:predicted phosphoadenosine phosphosulfate sulfurtransferase